MSTEQQSNLPSVQRAQETPTLIPSTHELTVYNTMASKAVQSKMYRGVGDESGIMMVMLAARELSIPPMQALNGGIHLIDGKVELSARMMNALIRRAGHSVQIKESTDDRCILVGRRCDNGDSATVSYSFADAQRAGLVREKGGWKRNPADMCFARALSRLARQLFPDCIGTAYVEGEIQQRGEVEIIEPQPEIRNEVVYVPPRDVADTPLWHEYIESVGQAYNWTREQVMVEFSKDLTKTYEKFDKWLARRMTEVVQTTPRE